MQSAFRVLRWAWRTLERRQYRDRDSQLVRAKPEEADVPPPTLAMLMASAYRRVASFEIKPLRQLREWRSLILA